MAIIRCTSSPLICGYLDRIVANIKDPAEVIAISVRHTLQRAEREPLWGRFLALEGFSRASVTHGLGRLVAGHP